ncbi:hypothetical protein MMC30_007716 [Trapelia coarctata]|nr:hypothetical protein [Trapelia coarctata]
MSQPDDQGKGKAKATPEVIDLLSSSASEAEPDLDMPANKAMLLKAELEEAIDPLAPVDVAVTEKVSPQNNSTNLHIIHLHDTMGLSWEDIAAELNKEAAKDKGKGPAIRPESSTSTSTSASAPAPAPAPAFFTKEMVYSRYQRARARLPPQVPTKRSTGNNLSVAGPSAAPNLDRGRPAFMVARHKKTAWDDEMDVFLVEAVKEARANFWGTVAQRVREKMDGKKEPKPEECQGRYLEL